MTFGGVSCSCGREGIVFELPILSDSLNIQKTISNRSGHTFRYHRQILVFDVFFHLYQLGKDFRYKHLLQCVR